MKFQVPQFLDIEDKIFGPFTFKQFIYILGGGGLIFILYRFLPGLIAFPLILVVGAFSLALAFYKFNNKPFADFLEASLRYVINNKLYIWKKKPPTTEEIRKKKEEQVESVAEAPVPRLSESKLRDIAWQLDTHNDDSQ